MLESRRYSKWSKSFSLNMTIAKNIEVGTLLWIIISRSLQILAQSTEDPVI